MSYVGFVTKVLVMMAVETFKSRCYLRSSPKFNRFDQLLISFSMVMTGVVSFVVGVIALVTGILTMEKSAFVAILSYAIGITLMVLSFRVFANSDDQQQNMVSRGPGITFLDRILGGSLRTIYTISQFRKKLRQNLINLHTPS